MRTLLAGLPIAVILVLMLGARWSAARAGVAGFGVAIAVGVGVFGFGTRVQPSLGAAGATLGITLEAAFVALTILWIIFPALCIHQLQERGGGMRTLRESIARVSPDPRIAALLVAWFFALFAEGAAGFGTPVALAAPFLVGLGYGRVEAVTIALLGHCVGVSFGAIGTPVLPQVAATGLDGLQIAGMTAVPHLLFGWVMLAFMMRLTARSMGAPERDRAVPHIVAWSAVAAASFLLPYAAIARWVGPELPTLGGALLGGTVFVGALLVTRGGRPAGDSARKDGRSIALLRAASPYLVLIALVLATRLIAPVEAVLRSVVLQWSLFGTFRGSMQPLFHPGTMLLAGFAIGAVIQRVPGREMIRAMSTAARQLAVVTIALLAMLGLARTMVHSGMVDLLATIIADSTGPLLPMFVPVIGALGTFITGSATASNILLTDLHVSAAARSGETLLVLVAGQGFGAAAGNIICPHNIIAGGATVGLVGREGEVIRRTLLPCAVYLLLGGAVLWWLA